MFKSKKSDVVAIDPWVGAGSSYVGRYRKQLDDLAAQISYRLWQKAYTEFDGEGSCVVVRTKDEIIARVRVNGEAGQAYAALIRTDLNESFHAQFNVVFQGLKVSFEPLRPYLVHL